MLLIAVVPATAVGLAPSTGRGPIWLGPGRLDGSPTAFADTSTGELNRPGGSKWRMEVALLGPAGTFTHEAALTFFDDVDPVFCPSHRQVFEADTDAAIIAFENLLGGSVGESIDLLREYDRTIIGEHVHPINHCLLSPAGSIDDITLVKSHPQALSQCRGLIEAHGWTTQETASTAQATTELGSGEAALGSALAGELAGLNLLAEGVQDNADNRTRFLILGQEPRTGEKTALILEPGEDRPGLLHSMLGCFSGHGINLAYIQSRPTKAEMGEYVFYVEAEVGLDADVMDRALQCLETYTEIDILGCYPAATSG